MLVSVKMITGFNTDVPHGEHVYHVQTEDRGRDHPVLESLVYVGGTIIARKRTSYTDQIESGASEEAIATLLRKQHQVIIAAIKAGRIEDLMKHSSGEKPGFGVRERGKPGARPAAVEGGDLTTGARTPAPEKAAKQQPSASPPQTATPATAQESDAQSAAATTASPPKPAGGKNTQGLKGQPGAGGGRGSGPLKDKSGQRAAAQQPASPPTKRNTGALNKKESPGNSGRIGLNLDQVISDYLKRSSEQGKLDLRVISPSVFMAGKSIALKIQVSRSGAAEPEAIVTVKVIGTAFKPQVYMGRSDSEGTTNFNLALPSFNAGTAAIVIEAQSNRGRGELKQLIRRG